MAQVLMKDLNKKYDEVHAVKDVNLHIRDKEFMVLVGPSGCGKSTTLRMVAGLEEISSGQIVIGERVVNDLPPKDRDIAMVFQNYALYPHMSVYQNMAYGLKIKKMPKDEIERRVQKAAAILELKPFLQRRPGHLSGGQRQRVAMGRAIVREPAVFLFDEPLSNLDAKLRVGMRAELSRLHERLGTTTVYVTHDQVEAMTLGQRVAVMRDGRIQQVDTPQALYREPVNLFVAAFIGSPAMNLVEARVDDGALEFAVVRVPLHPRRRPSEVRDGRVIVGIRPEDFEDAEYAEAGRPQLDVTPSVVEDIGADVHVIFPLEAPRVVVDEAVAGTEDASLLADEHSRFNARVDPRTRARPGGVLRLAVDTGRLYFFDRESGRNLTRG